jgi:hypothetical protein
LEARVYDVAGRSVGALSPASDRSRLHWDGLDATGARLPSGVYFIAARDRGAEIRRRVTIIR